MEYILYCDESSDKGPKYSDFFGGCIVSSKNAPGVISALEMKKRELHLGGEIKWTKVTANYLDYYIQMVDLFFDLIKDGKVKMRVMFRKNEDTPHRRDVCEKDDKYFKLYYQFIKHSFGLMAIPEDEGEVFLRVYFDQLPDTKIKCEKFKDFIRNLPSTNDFQKVHGRLYIRKEDVAEVRSHNHVLLQCVDIVLGAMYFRLNELHCEKPEGSRSRGKRTIAKEKLYKHINKRICELLPNFNIGISTGQRDYDNPDWELPYSHWRFVPR